jgi:hypothetical protein
MNGESMKISGQDRNTPEDLKTPFSSSAFCRKDSRYDIEMFAMRDSLKVP